MRSDTYQDKHQIRGADITRENLFTTVHLETFAPSSHPIRSIKALSNQATKHIHCLLDSAYSEDGRESTPPERLLHALLLQALYTIRSEHQLVEQVSYNLLFRWFAGLGRACPESALDIDDEV